MRFTAVLFACLSIVQGDGMGVLRKLSDTKLAPLPGLPACIAMAAPQVIVVALLLYWGQPWHAGAVALALLGQGALMPRFLSDPRKQAIWFSAFGVLLYVTGMMISAFALRGLTMEGM